MELIFYIQNYTDTCVYEAKQQNNEADWSSHKRQSHGPSQGHRPSSFIDFSMSRGLISWCPKPINVSWLQQLQALRLGCPTEFLPALPNCVGSWRGHLELQGLPKRTPKNSRRTGTPISSASPCCTNICSRCESQESSASSITWRNSHGQFSPDYKKLEYETLISELDMAKILSRWLCLTSHLQRIS